MSPRRLLRIAVPVAIVLAAGWCLAQAPGFRRPMPRGGMMDNRNGVPDWKVDPRFRNDVFTFVRLQYQSMRGGSVGAGSAAGGLVEVDSVEVGSVGAMAAEVAAVGAAAGRPTFPTATSTSPIASSSSPR